MGLDGKPDEYDEETVDAQGHKVKKHVRKGPGWSEVQIESDGPLDLGNVIGQMLSQQMQSAVSQRPPMQMRQMSSSRPLMFGPPPELIAQMMHDDMGDDDIFEDPFMVINELERNRRRPPPPMFAPPPFFGGPPIVPPFHEIADDHALVPKSESPHSLPDAAKAGTAQ